MLYREASWHRLARTLGKAALVLCAVGYAEAAELPVAYFNAEQVQSAFAKGAVLYDGSGGANYMVHASRRETAGQVEVHNLDTDVIHVLEGGATLVTGGKVVGGKVVAPEEIRGSDVQGGETRHIAKGDVIIVPKGTPHWFQSVEAPLLYYVVKVR